MARTPQLPTWPTVSDPVRLSKRLAHVLRHHPEDVGLALDAAGWVDLDELLQALSSRGRTVTRGDVEGVLARPGKQRFEVAGNRIRATHGHSVPVELGLPPTVPPDVLYHGTVARFLDDIAREGLRPQGRRAVHLSTDVAGARQVGARRGRPVVLQVDAAAMHAAGHVFRQPGPDVWLTAAVPPEHLTRVNA